jgi:hypothetical protein
MQNSTSKLNKLIHISSFLGPSAADLDVTKDLQSSIMNLQYEHCIVFIEGLSVPSFHHTLVPLLSGYSSKLHPRTNDAIHKARNLKEAASFYSHTHGFVEH